MVRRMVIGRADCGQGSSAVSGISHGGAFLSPRPWLNQSRIMNWIQGATRTLSVSAGWNWWRVSSSRLTVRGLGESSAGVGSGKVRERGTLRPKRVLALPIVGSPRSLKVPSALRVVSAAGPGKLSGGRGRDGVMDDGSYRFS